MTVVKRGSVETKKKKTKSVYGVLYLSESDCKIIDHSDFVEADRYDIEFDGSVANFYISSEEEDGELVASIKGWKEIRKIEYAVYQGILKQREKLLAELEQDMKTKSNSVFAAPGH